MPFTELHNELNERAALGLLRQRRMLQSPQAPHITVDGKSYLSFCSNDYLGLANHPQMIAALQQGAQQHGVGAGAAHLVSGHGATHHQLEHELAAFVGKPAALLFSTGYMANLGVVQALVGKGDTVFADKFNHASLNDAMQLSRAKVKRYRHNDMAQLAQLMEQAGSSSRPDTEGCNPLAREGRLDEHSRIEGYRPPCHARRRKLVITDAVFSMDGDLAPLPELLALCEQHDAWLLIDDAHGFGVLGAQGRGTLSHFALSDTKENPGGRDEMQGAAQRATRHTMPVGEERVSTRYSSLPARQGCQRIIYMATLGKAAGVFGAFVAAEQVVIDTLVNHARSYVYTTATPPALASALLESLQQIEKGDELRGHLQRLIAQLRSGLRGLPWHLMSSSTAIQPMLVGDNLAALRLSERLREHGIWVAAIRPPTVPQGTARLRITLSAAHGVADVRRLIDTLHELAR
ncbi:MAG: 8-amino-7-oxononanoate synthase [Gallionella sp.]